MFSVLLLPRMREVDLGCGKALLIKESGEFHAVGHKCPHYGAPLVKGQSVSHPRRLTKGIKVLAKDVPVFTWLCCWARGSAVPHTQHHLGVFSLGEGMGRKLGVHKPPGSTSPQLWFAGDPTLPLLVTGLGLLWVTLKNKTARAPVIRLLLHSSAGAEPLFDGKKQLQLTVPMQSPVSYCSVYGFPATEELKCLKGKNKITL